MYIAIVAIYLLCLLGDWLHGFLLFLFQDWSWGRAGAGAGAGVGGRQTAENDAASLPLRTDKHALCSPTATPGTRSQLQSHATQSPKQTHAMDPRSLIISGNTAKDACHTTYYGLVYLTDKIDSTDKLKRIDCECLFALFF